MSDVAALFVRASSHYKTISGVDCYDFQRDALTWPGGVPGVFHPPCRAWAGLSQFAKPRPGERELAFWAMAMCRRFGGVVEHPFASRLWAESECGSFGVRDRFGGVLIPFYQSWFGHRAQKKSCLYVVGSLPVLPDSSPLLPTVTVENMGRPERERTPPALSRWLVDVARSSKVVS